MKTPAEGGVVCKVIAGTVDKGGVRTQNDGASRGRESSTQDMAFLQSVQWPGQA